MTKEGGFLAGVKPLDSSSVTLFLLQLIAIICISRLLAVVLKYFREPPVIAEVLTGIIMGPSVFGLIPGFSSSLFPVASLVNLSFIANLGLILYLFVVGLEMDIGYARKSAKESFAISAAGIVFPFVLSIIASYVLYDLYRGSENVAFGTFILFIGVDMSITAFPVLARIIGELGLFNTTVGVQTISAAAFDDIVAWCILAIVISIVNASDTLNSLYVMLMLIAFILIMFYVLKPTLTYLLARRILIDQPISQSIVVVIMLTVFAAAFTTEVIGVHAIFGAFITGLIIPRKNNMPVLFTEKIEDLVSVVLLPVYFTLSGLRTNLGLLNSPAAWGYFFMIIVLSMFGKIIGCAVVARMVKIPWRESFTIGVLMNTKGLIELIILNIGLDSGVIDQTIFSMLVLKAIVLTCFTSPVVNIIYPPYRHKNITQSSDVEMESASDIFKTSEIHFKSLYLPGMSYISSLLSIIKIFSPGKNSHRADLHAVRAISTSYRSSTIMKAAHPVDSLNHDSVINVFNSFASVNRINVNGHFIMSSEEDLANEICQVGSNSNLNLIVIPCTNPKFAVVEPGAEVFEENTFVKNIADIWNKTLAIVMDGIPSIQSLEIYSIFVPFFGGPDDREALLFALRVGKSRKSRIHVLHIKLRENDTNISFDIEKDDITLLDRVKASAVRPDSSECQIIYEETSEEVKNALQPILKVAGKSDYSIFCFGYGGVKWVPLFNSLKIDEPLYSNVIESNEKTALSNSSTTRNEHSFLNQLTSRSLQGMFHGSSIQNRKEKVKSGNTFTVHGPVGDSILSVNSGAALIALRNTRLDKFQESCKHLV
jgi:Kef-type K+ transport system membrane component KefB